MWTSQTTTDGKPTGYGYGWDVKQQNGILWVEHSGHQPGASNILLLLPSRGFAVSIMSNTDNINITPMAETLANAYLNSGAARQ
jgi:CubicO group peptidase (beta-lactamase class C family)